MGPPTPSSSGGAPPARAVRYGFLVARLRNRQITMEEATELFGLMDETMRGLRSAMAAAPPPGPSAASAPTPPAPRKEAPVGRAGFSDDDLIAAGILLLGLGAGLGSAVRERARRGPKAPPPTSANPAKSGTP